MDKTSCTNLRGSTVKSCIYIVHVNDAGMQGLEKLLVASLASSFALAVDYSLSMNVTPNQIASIFTGVKITLGAG